MIEECTDELAFSEQMRPARLFDKAIAGTPQKAVDFITNILESPEYCVIGNDLKGKILLWAEKTKERCGRCQSANRARLEEKNAALKRTIEALERAHGRIVELNTDLERRVAERTADLEAANRGLEKKNAEIQNFYHTLSHELKTPLTSAREFIALVAEGVAGPVNAGQRGYLGLALEGCDQLAVCINDLLDATRLETGKMALHLKPGSLGEVVKRVLAALKHTAAEKMISLQEDVAAELPAVLMDETRMSQIITNLVNNALKFTANNGRVRVSVKQCVSRRGLLEVSVSDTGRGIAKDQLELIFDRLYQVKDGDAASEQGVGLGLYLCRELVGLHGGDIRVESELGKGSTFTFTVPEAQIPNRPRVLVIEDNPKLSELTGGRFEKNGDVTSTPTRKPGKENNI